MSDGTLHIDRSEKTTRERLIDAARAMMAEGGEQSVSIVGAAETVGVNRTTAHHHFRNRRELIEAARKSGGGWNERYKDRPLPRLLPDRVAAGIAGLDVADAKILAFETLEERPEAIAYLEKVRARLAQRKQRGRLSPNVDIEMAALHIACWGVFAPAFIGSMDLQPQDEEVLMRRLGVEMTRVLLSSIYDRRDDPGFRHWLENVSREESLPKNTELDFAVRDVARRVSSRPAEDTGDRAEGLSGDGEADTRGTRSRILDMALALMANGGDAAVSISKVAQNVPLARTTVHTYFRTREDLIDAAYEELTRRMPAPVFGRIDLDTFDPSLIANELAHMDIGICRIWSYDFLKSNILTHPHFLLAIERIVVFERDDRFFSDADIAITAVMGVIQGLVMAAFVPALAESPDERKDARLRFAREAVRIWVLAYVDYERHPRIHQWLEEGRMAPDV